MDKILKEISDWKIFWYDQKELVSAMNKNMKVWSWWAEKFTTYESKVLYFKVNWAIHKWFVALSVNLDDYFEIDLISKDWKHISKIGNIWIEDLIETIDGLVENHWQYV